MAEKSKDPELSAIETIISTLEHLDSDAQGRVIAYAISRFDISSVSTAALLAKTPSREGELEAVVSIPSPEAQVDIRSLKEEKKPSSAIEMAVVVEYYLSELAPIEDRKSSINTSDLEIFFKQAKFRMPKGIQNVLPNVKKAGYMETVSKGEYRLNSVGYNLAVHGLPKSSTN